MDTQVTILIGETEPENAVRLSKTVHRCPYCVCFSHSAGTILGLYVIPAGHRWWLEWVEQHPKATLGLRRAEVLYAQRLETSSRWSRGETKAILKQAPCGAVCTECTMYKEKCPGCPDTQYYLEI